MSDFVRRVQKVVREDMQSKVNYITSGSCKDIADYRACCAELVGMHNTVQLMTDMAAEQDKLEDNWEDGND